MENLNELKEKNGSTAFSIRTFDHLNTVKETADSYTLSKMQNLKEFKEEGVGTTAVPIKDINLLNKPITRKIIEFASKSVCKIYPAHMVQGTCAFYQVLDQYRNQRFLIMTCNHVLPTNSLNEIIQAIFEFGNIPQLTSFCLVKKHLKYVWTSKLLDATVMEISPEQAAQFKSLEIKFLKVGKAKLNEEVAILQYPLGILSIAHGEIEELSGADVFYRMGTADGSSGSPLLKWDCVAIAMHNSGTEGATGQQPASRRKAIVLEAVINAYLTDESEMQKEILSLKLEMSKSMCVIKNDCTSLSDLR